MDRRSLSNEVKRLVAGCIGTDVDHDIPHSFTIQCSQCPQSCLHLFCDSGWHENLECSFTFMLDQSRDSTILRQAKYSLSHGNAEAFIGFRFIDECAGNIAQGIAGLEIDGSTIDYRSDANIFHSKKCYALQRASQ